MEKVREYLGDTILLALAGIYFYFVYIQSQYGYLKSFGLPDVSGLVPLQTQRIIPNVITSGFASIAFLAAGLSLSILLARKFKRPKSRKMKFVRTEIVMVLPLLVITSPFLLAIYLIHPNQFYISLAYICLTAAVVPLLDGYYSSGKPKGNVTKPISFLLDKVSPNLNKQQIIMTVVMLIFYLPLLSYSVGQITARLQDTYYVTYRDKQEYAVLEVYENEEILVQIKDKQIEPVFLILKNDELNKINLKTTSTGRLKFEKVDKLIKPGYGF